MSRWFNNQGMNAGRLEGGPIISWDLDGVRVYTNGNFSKRERWFDTPAGAGDIISACTDGVTLAVLTKALPTPNQTPPYDTMVSYRPLFGAETDEWSTSGTLFTSGRFGDMFITKSGARWYVVMGDGALCFHSTNLQTWAALNPDFPRPDPSTVTVEEMQANHNYTAFFSHDATNNCIVFVSTSSGNQNATKKKWLKSFVNHLPHSTLEFQTFAELGGNVDYSNGMARNTSHRARANRLMSDNVPFQLNYIKGEWWYTTDPARTVGAINCGKSKDNWTTVVPEYSEFTAPAPPFNTPRAMDNPSAYLGFYGYTHPYTVPTSSPQPGIGSPYHTALANLTDVPSNVETGWRKNNVNNIRKYSDGQWVHRGPVSYAGIGQHENGSVIRLGYNNYLTIMDIKSDKEAQYTNLLTLDVTYSIIGWYPCYVLIPRVKPPTDTMMFMRAGANRYTTSLYDFTRPSVNSPVNSNLKFFITDNGYHNPKYLGLNNWIMFSNNNRFHMRAPSTGVWKLLPSPAGTYGVVTK